MMNTIEMDDAMDREWNDTTTMMGWVAPGFRHIGYKMLATNHNAGLCKGVPVISRDVPVAATDGANCIINPDTYFKYTLPERVFIYGHEIVHNMMGDVELLHRCAQTELVPMKDGTSLPFDNDTMQRAMDYRINALLVKSRIGKLPKDGLFDPAMDGSESVLDVYAKEYKKKFKDKQDPNGPSNKPGNKPGKGQFDQLLQPGASTGKDPAQAAAGRNQQAWNIAIAAAQTIEQDRAQGKMSGNLMRMFEKMLTPEVDWREHIKTLINRVAGSGGWNFKQPDEWWTPHDFFQPRKTGKGAGWIVAWGDTSGSRTGNGGIEIASTVAETAGIIEDVNPARFTMLWGDDAITGIEEVTDMADLKDMKPKGGGGTSMGYVFDWINKQDSKPDLLLCFTDGHVTFPKRAPDYPVIWASSTDVKYPFGSVVRVLKRTPQP